MDEGQEKVESLRLQKLFDERLKAQKEKHGIVGHLTIQENYSLREKDND